MQVPTANNLEKFISDFILDAARRCFKYAVEKEYHKIPVWSGAAQASTQTGNDIGLNINFGISPKATHSGIAYGKSKGSYKLSISGDDLVEGWESGLNYFKFLDKSAGRSPTSPWKYEENMWKSYEERYNDIINSEYENAMTNFLGIG